MAERRPPLGAPTQSMATSGETEIDRVVVINDFARPSGGATIIALQAAAQYRQLGYAVTYICGDAPSADLDELDITQVALNLRPLLELSSAQALISGVHNRQAERAIREWIDLHDTDRTVYHLHNWSQILSPAVFGALRKVERRLVVTCHDFSNVCPNGGYTNFQTNRPCELQPLSAHCLVTQCDRRSAAHKYWRILRQSWLLGQARFANSKATFTCINQHMQDQFEQAGFAAADLMTVPNPAEAWARQRIPAERNEGFLFVGRISTDKGADLAIKAARAAGQKLTLIGDSGDMSVDRVSNDPDVTFGGWLSPQEIAQIARRARALIVPSRVVEPFGLVILEAAMSGLPVIVSDHAYLANDVERLGFGQKFDVGDTDALFAKLTQFASDDNMIASMSEAGYIEARSLCHSVESWTSVFVDVFRRKLKQQGLVSTGPSERLQLIAE